MPVELVSLKDLAQLFFNSSVRIGSLRIRLPVAAKMALTTAGAIWGTAASPTPLGLSALGTMVRGVRIANLQRLVVSEVERRPHRSIGAGGLNDRVRAMLRLSFPESESEERKFLT